MTTSRKLRGIATMGVLVGGLVIVAAACNGDDDDAVTTAKKDASIDSTSTIEAGDDGPSTLAQAICSKYGQAKIPLVANSLLANAKADCRIGTYFTELPDKGAHFASCITVQLSTFFGCPGASYGTDAKDSNGKACLNMKDAHKTLGISDSDFSAFNDDVIAALNSNGITDTDDVQSILSTLGTTETSVVTSNSKYDPKCTCDGGSYMGKACIGDGGTDDASDTGTDTGTDKDTGTDTGTADTGTDTGADAGTDAGADADAGDGS